MGGVAPPVRDEAKASQFCSSGSVARHTPPNGKLLAGDFNARVSIGMGRRHHVATPDSVYLVWQVIDPAHAGLVGLNKRRRI